MNSWVQISQWGLAWGPGLIILVGLFVLLRRPPQFVGEFISAQKEQAVAMTKLAGAVEKVSDPTRKLDEILVGQQLILNRQQAQESRLAGIEKSVDGLKVRGT